MSIDYGTFRDGRGSALLPASESRLAPTLFAGHYQYPVAMPVREAPQSSALQLALQVLQRFWKLILACVLMALMLALGLLAVVSPVYEADALVQVDLNDKSQSKALSDEMSGKTGAPTPVTAEIELLKSRLVLGPVVDELQLNIVATPSVLPVLGPWIASWPRAARAVRSMAPGWGGYAWGGEQLRLLSIDVPPSLLGQALTLRITAPQAYAVYQADRLLFSGNVGDSVVAPFPDGDLVLRVRSLSGDIGTRFDLAVSSRVDAIRQLLEGYRATEQGKDSGLIRISYRGEDPQQISSVVNIAIREYQDQDVRWRTAKAARTLEFLGSQLPALKKKVEAAEGALTRHKFNTEAPDLTVETGLLLQQSVSSEDTLLQLQQQREELTQRYTQYHPSMLAIDAQIRQATAARKRIERRIRTLPASQRELATLTRDLEVNMRLYVAMLDESQQLEVAKSGTIGVVRIVDTAVVPSQPLFPRPAIILAAALIAGLVGGIFLASLLGATRDRIETATDLERAAAPRCLATIRQSSKQRALQRGSARLRSHGDPTLLAQAFPTDPAMDGLRRLRAAVMTEPATKDGAIILIAGMTPGVGRTFILANLAVMLVGAVQRTVMVDVDLDQRSLQRDFPSTGIGVSEWLLGHAQSLDEVVEIAHPGLPDLVPAGRCTNLLRGSLTPQRLRSLLNELRARYDYVLVNAPPLSTFADSLLVATAVDGVILVASQFQHGARDVADLDQRLGRAGINVIGTVLNQVQLSDRLGYLGQAART